MILEHPHTWPGRRPIGKPSRGRPPRAGRLAGRRDSRRRSNAAETPTAESLVEWLGNALQPDVATTATHVADAVRTDGADTAAHLLIDTVTSHVEEGSLVSTYP